MGFIEEIVGGLSGIFGDLFGIGDLLSGASSTGILTALGGLANIVATLTANISSLITGLAGEIGAFISPITQIVGSVSTLANTIQTQIIGPILGPITTTIQTFERLDTTISRLVDQGISGLIQIPAAIADALTSVNSSFERSTRQLATSWQQTTQQTLLPGFGEILTPGLGKVSDAFMTFTQPKGLSVVQLPVLNFMQSKAEGEVKRFLEEHLRKWQNPTSWMDQLGAVLLDALTTGAVFSATIGNVIQKATNAANAGDPSRVLDPATTVEAFKRGLVDEASARAELGREGLDQVRQTALLELSEFIPDLGMAGDLYLRGVIDTQGLRDVTRRLGLTAPMHEAWLDTLEPLVPAPNLVDWFQRGLLTQQQFNDRMAAHGYKADLIQTIAQAGKQPRNIATAILSRFNIAAASHGWFPESYNSDPPPDVLQIGKLDGLEDDEVKRIWNAKWAAMPISTAVNLFFRGEMNRTEVKIVVEQNGFPPAMTDLFITSLNTLLPFRSIPNLIEDGSLSPDEGRAKLAQRGFLPEDIDLLIGAAERKRDSQGTAPETDATKLSVTAIGDAYETGLIDEATYRSLLQERGLSGADADITIALKQYQLMVQQKKDEVDTLKAEVQLGTLTVAAAVNRLLESGFTGPEVSRIQVQLIQTKRANAKMPELATIKRMVKAAILTTDDFFQYLLATGYSEEWAGRILQLETAQGESDG